MTRFGLYSNCSDLPLKNFCKVINTSDYKYLSRVGFITHVHDVSALWSEILLEYAALDNNYTVQEKWDDSVELLRLQNSYTTIKAMIRFLWHVSPTKPSDNQDTAIIAYNDLTSMGYKIDITSNESYLESLKRADSKCNSIVTLIQMRKNKMADVHEESNINFDEIISMLSVNAQMNIPEDITVSRYIAYKNSIISKLKSKNGTT